MAPDAEIHFERIAVTLEQIREWDLPTRPTKTSDSRAKDFGDISVELDAIPPDRLRDLVDEAISRHLPQHQLNILKIAEAEERKLLRGLVGLMEAHLCPPSPSSQEPYPALRNSKPRNRGRHTSRRRSRSP